MYKHKIVLNIEIQVKQIFVTYAKFIFLLVMRDLKFITLMKNVKEMKEYTDLIILSIYFIRIIIIIIYL